MRGWWNNWWFAQGTGRTRKDDWKCWGIEMLLKARSLPVYQVPTKSGCHTNRLSTLQCPAVSACANQAGRHQEREGSAL
jgi:hypothetical protein